MTPAERGFLLLSSHLGEKNRNPLTTAQLRILADRVRGAEVYEPDRNLEPKDLMALGYGSDMAHRIHRLLEEEDVLNYYLRKAQILGCTPVTRVSEHYPLHLRKRLGLDSTGLLLATAGQCKNHAQQQGNCNNFLHFSRFLS